jgi:hypothetical protein
LRARFVRQPVALYRQLQQLGLETDAQARFDAPESPPTAPICPPGPAGAAAGFAAAIAGHLAGPVLPYSQRLVLLHEADQRGIPRFEANLIIAAVQHRHQYATCPPIAITARRFPSLISTLLFILVQSAILLCCIWWIALR